MISVPIINKWLWDRPTVYQHLSIPDRPVTGWTDAPVYPINEQPESKAPYVIYTWTTKSDWLYFIQNDEITYYLWDIDIYRLMQLQSAIKDQLGRVDETAAAIRQWMHANGESGGVLDIKSVEYGGSSQIFTQTQESGVVGLGMTFRVKYLDCSTKTPLV